LVLISGREQSSFHQLTYQLSNIALRRFLHFERLHAYVRRGQDMVVLLSAEQAFIGLPSRPLALRGKSEACRASGWQSHDLN
jgi:hypothetical protein